MSRLGNARKKLKKLGLYYSFTVSLKQLNLGLNIIGLGIYLAGTVLLVTYDSGPAPTIGIAEIVVGATMATWKLEPVESEEVRS